MAMDWAVLPNWISAVAAFSALIFAAIAARAAWNANQLQVSQLARLHEIDRRRAETDSRSLAAQVAGWVRLDQDGLPVIVFLNGGQLPIFDLVLEIYFGEAESDVVQVEYSVKGPDRAPKVLNHATKLLRNEYARAIGGAIGGGPWISLYTDGLLGVSFRFIDSAGIPWMRSRRGILVRSDTL